LATVSIVHQMFWPNVDRLSAGEFVAVLVAATTLVVVAAVYQWGSARARREMANERIKRLEKAEEEERRLLLDALTYGIE
jgi:K+ transporter